MGDLTHIDKDALTTSLIAAKDFHQRICLGVVELLVNGNVQIVVAEVVGQTQGLVLILFHFVPRGKFFSMFFYWSSVTLGLTEAVPQ